MSGISCCELQHKRPEKTFTPHVFCILILLNRTMRSAPDIHGAARVFDSLPLHPVSIKKGAVIYTAPFSIACLQLQPFHFYFMRNLRISKIALFVSSDSATRLL